MLLYSNYTQYIDLTDWCLSALKFLLVIESFRDWLTTSSPECEIHSTIFNASASLSRFGPGISKLINRGWIANGGRERVGFQVWIVSEAGGFRVMEGGN